jgi:hypothetical protein
MDDLIWIGNTLYPRWLVIAVAAIVVVAVLFGFTYLTRKA